MRVLLVHNRYRSAISGEDRVFDQESTALATAGHVVERFERCSDDIEHWGIGRRTLVPGRVVWSDQARRDLRRVLARFRPDVVHLHNTFPLISPSVLYACRAAKVPTVVTLHNYRLICPGSDLFRDGAICHDCVGRTPIPAVQHGCYRGSTMATIPVALGTAGHHRTWRSTVSAYIFLSGPQRDIFAADGFPADRLFVKANFIPEAAPPEPPGSPMPGGTGSGIVTYAGRLSPLKGVLLLMDAWDRYRSGVAAGAGGIRLVVAGDGPLEGQVASWAASRPSVDWVGSLTRSECAALVARARAAIVPSQWEETFGLIVVEAMAAGVPPVATAHGSFPEIITDGHDGVLFEPTNPTALARVFHDIETDPGRYAAMGRAARRTYEKRFTADVNMAQLADIYQFAIDHPAWLSPQAVPT